MKGYIQVYTGDGKGKTTAALGLALRAAGAGMKVFFAQFLKSEEYSEIDALKKFGDAITFRQYGRKKFVCGKPESEDIRLASEGLADARAQLISGGYDLVILDEANIAVFFDLFSVHDLIEVMESKPVQTELVITGRRAAPEIIERADLVTEMKEVKHYHAQGVKARKGIEL